MISDCPVCGEHAETVTLPFEGYISGWTTCIGECARCQLSFSTRRDVPDGLYDNIYRQADQIPGYNRYVGYADQIRTQADPGAWLAEREEPYRVALDWLDRQAEVGQVLEIGSGLGYLTHALRRRGTAAVGVDLSEEVVRAARNRFDDHDAYLLPEEVAQLFPQGFDTVIGLEIVEHVPDPVAFVREAMGYLKPGGTLVLSTPNRDAFTRETLWYSDTPPVHLTWFGSLSMRVVADAVSADLEIISSETSEAGHLPNSGSSEMFAPFLTESGEVTWAARNWSNRWRRRADNALAGLAGSLRDGRQRLPGVPRPWLVAPTSTTLGVALRPRTDA